MQYKTIALTKDEILTFLKKVDNQFIPMPLSESVDLPKYATKLANLSTQFVCYINDEIAGMTACYLNNLKTKKAFISVTVIDSRHKGKGIGKTLTKLCEAEAKNQGFSFVEFEVNKSNNPSIQMHLTIGYTVDREEGESFYMIKKI
ncbi:MAG: GNAT family N-acetyltransferase [Salinivirgaceae bacterium]|nr:GNAT family N-acetyltransferase [Salinivirgaceae bacterium]